MSTRRLSTWICSRPCSSASGMGRSRDQEIRRSLPSLLVGKMFDDRGNPMTPMHANKGRVRYRDYVSHALLRGRKAEAGAVGRVPAPDIEQLVIGAMRAAFNQERDVSDGVLVQSRLNKAIVHRDRIEITCGGTKPPRPAQHCRDRRFRLRSMRPFHSARMCHIRRLDGAR